MDYFHLKKKFPGIKVSTNILIIMVINCNLKVKLSILFTPIISNIFQYLKNSTLYFKMINSNDKFEEQPATLCWRLVNGFKLNQLWKNINSRFTPSRMNDMIIGFIRKSLSLRWGTEKKPNHISVRNYHSPYHSVL